MVVKAAWDELIDRPGSRSRPRAGWRPWGLRRAEESGRAGLRQRVAPLPVPSQPLLPATHPALDQVLGDQKHRAVRYSVTAATRFREYFLGIPEGDPPLREGPEQTVHVLNASRPDPLPVHSIVPIYNWDRDLLAGQYQHAAHLRAAGLPAPPLGPHRDGRAPGGGGLRQRRQRRGEPGAQRPGVRLISATLDPLEDEANVAPPLLETSFPARKEVLKTMALLEPGRSRAPSSYGVTVVGHEVKYNAERDLWYADVEIAGIIDRFPFLRLGLVRFQPYSTAGCHVSRVDLPDPVQIMPQRTLIASTSGPAREMVASLCAGHACRTRTSRRSTTGGCSTTPSPRPWRSPSPAARRALQPDHRRIDAAQPGGDRQPVRAAAPAPAPQVVPAEYLGGRIVVREHQRGRNILSGANESRWSTSRRSSATCPQPPSTSARPRSPSRAR